ncbi:MAG: hypothetical protein ACI8TQ_001864 [Planctomycetota bacterium]|jgi:hypothetical protein
MSGNDAIGLYGPNGESIRTIPLQEVKSYHEIVHDGSTVIPEFDGLLRIYRKGSDQPVEFELPDPTESGVQGIFRGADAKELMVLMYGSLTLFRYAWPG